MSPSTMHNGDLGSILVPARPILDELIDGDAGEQWEAVQNNHERMAMVQSGLCGLLYPDIAHLTPAHRSGFFADIEFIRGKAHLSLLAPQQSLAEASLDRLSNAGTSIVAGIAYAPQQIAHTREVVQTILSRSDVINAHAEKEDISIVFQGGARISDAEYTFAKMVGAEIARFPHAPKKFITGGGRGIMRAPLSGARLVGLERGESDTTNCGVSCGKIIAAEPPNSIVQHLAVFEQIERRLEAFTRSGQLTVLFPGGTGTFEELLYILAVMTEAKNNDTYYNFLLVGDETKREYYDIILQTLEEALGKDIIEQTQIRDRICIGKPDEVAQRILHEAEFARWSRRQEILMKNPADVRMDFHGGIHIPRGLRTPFSPTRENVEGLQLNENADISDAIVHLRRLIFTKTCVCISEREREEVRQNGPFRIQGNPQVIATINTLFRAYERMGRLNGGGEYLETFVAA